MSAPARKAVLVSDRDLTQAAGAAQSWPQHVSHEPVMKIGEVVEALRTAFPALSISKVRYLESEGLIHPHRVGNGYRQYSKADVERLRFALTAQREEYLPLSVIRERLQTLDAQAPKASPARIVACDGQLVNDGTLTLADFLHASGATTEQVEALLEAGIVQVDARGAFQPGSVHMARLALRLHNLGVPLRNLRLLHTSAEREADLIEQTLKYQHADAVDSLSGELTKAATHLHEALLKRAIAALL